jgi:hypothetical protein
MSPRADYTPRAPRPNLRDMGFERVAEILHKRMRGNRGAYYCFVLPSGTTYLRATRESRTDLPSQNSWIGTYRHDTPVEMIESDLIDRMRELTNQLAA